MPSVAGLLGFCLLPASLAWEFPAPPRFNDHQRPMYLNSHDDVDIISESQFRGLKTYANLPYLNCLSDEESKDKHYDIAFLGAPFDTVCDFKSW